MKTKLFSAGNLIYFLFIWILYIIIYPCRYTAQTGQSDIDTLYYLPDSTTFIDKYAIAGEIYNIFTRFPCPKDWQSFEVKEIHYLFSSSYLNDTLVSITLYQDTLKTNLYTEIINKKLDSTNVFPNWCKIVLNNTSSVFQNYVEVPITPVLSPISSPWVLAAPRYATRTSYTFGFYETTQGWGVTTDWPVKLIIKKKATEVAYYKINQPDFVLSQNFPNPFNPTTTISYSIPEQSYVELKVYNMLGCEVKTLVSKKQNAGEYRLRFDGSNLPSGIYIYTIHAGQYRASKKLMLLK